MDLFKLFFFPYPVKDILSFSLLFFFLLVPLGGFSLAVGYELAYLLQKKAIFNKLALQLSKLGFIFLVLLAGLIVFIAFSPTTSRHLGNTYLMLQFYLWACFGVSLGMQALVFCLQAKTNLAKWLRFSLGVVRWASYFVFFVLLFMVIHNVFSHLARLPVNNLGFWLGISWFWVVSILLGASVGLIFLVFRRQKDDFGRDYYKFALRSLALWMIVMAGISLLPFLGMLWQLNWTVPLNFFYYRLGLALFCLGILAMFGLFLRSYAQPMRLKAWFFVLPVFDLGVLLGGLLCWLQFFLLTYPKL